MMSTIQTEKSLLPEERAALDRVRKRSKQSQKLYIYFAPMLSVIVLMVWLVGSHQISVRTAVPAGLLAILLLIQYKRPIDDLSLAVNALSKLVEGAEKAEN